MVYTLTIFYVIDFDVTLYKKIYYVSVTINGKYSSLTENTLYKCTVKQFYEYYTVGSYSFVED